MRRRSVSGTNLFPRTSSITQTICVTIRSAVSHCKDEMFTRLNDVAREKGFEHVVYGVNTDDLGDLPPRAVRPPKSAMQRPRWWTPGFAKPRFERFRKRRGFLSGTGPPPLAWLRASLTARKLRGSGSRRSRTARKRSRVWGFSSSVCVYHGELVRLEFGPEELPRALSVEMAGKLTAIFKPLGFHYVTIDLEGYRQGVDERSARRQVECVAWPLSSSHRLVILAHNLHCFRIPIQNPVFEVADVGQQGRSRGAEAKRRVFYDWFARAHGVKKDAVMVLVIAVVAW